MHQPGRGHETADKAEVDPDGFRLALNLQREPFQRSATVPRDPLPTAMQKCLEGHDTLESAGAMPGLGVDLIDQRRPLNCSASVCSPPDARKNPTATQERDEVHETDVNSVWRDTAPHAPAATAAAASIADAAVRVPQRIGVISSLSSSASVGRRAGEYTRPRAFAPEHHRDRPGPVAVRQAMDLLGSILGHALVSGRISENPARRVKKARLARREEVQAASPATVEAMRAALSVRDATLLSVLAYAGLRPGEALGVRWGDIRERTMLIQRSISLGEEADTKTRRHRTVRLLAPLAADLRSWRMAAGRPDDEQLVFAGRDGQPWTQAAYQSWRRRAFHRAAQAAGLAHARPYDLRHSFASLLLHEGRSVIYVARQLGHDARLTLTRYGHVMDELEDAPRIEAEVAIAEARRQAGPGEPGAVSEFGS